MTPTPRKVVKARRRFPDCEGVPNEESTKEDVPSPEKPRFALNGSFDKPTQKKEENAENGQFVFNFQNSAKAAEKGEIEKKPAVFGKALGDQVKLFPQKNLFCNPMIKEIPAIKADETSRAHFKP